MSENKPAPAAGKKSKSGLLIVVALIALLGGGAAGAYFYFVRGTPAEAKEKKHEPEPESGDESAGTGIVPLDTFVVNLADPAGSRFLRVTLALVVQDEEHAKEVEESAVEKARIRSAILELLALQHADALVTPEGKTELKKAIAEQVAHAVHAIEVSDVLFSEFVVQF